jgi:hypothetical protein
VLRREHRVRRVRLPSHNYTVAITSRCVGHRCMPRRRLHTRAFKD